MALVKEVVKGGEGWADGEGGWRGVDTPLVRLIKDWIGLWGSGDALVRALCGFWRLYRPKEAIADMVASKNVF